MTKGTTYTHFLSSLPSLSSFYILIPIFAFLISTILSTPTWSRNDDDDVPAHVSFIQNSNFSPFEKAILSHKLHEVRAMLEKNKALLNPKDTTKGFPLMYAVLTNSPVIVEYLLQMGANVEAEMEGGVTAMGMAVHWNLIDVIRVLIQYKADVNKKINDVTYLDTAYMSRYQEVVEELKKAEAKTSRPGVTYPELNDSAIHPIRKKSSSRPYNAGAGGTRPNINDTGRSVTPVIKVEPNVIQDKVQEQTPVQNQNVNSPPN